MASDAVLERLKALHPRTIDLSLGRIERLLAALGHPERRLPPVIHVAGTNGKGSVVAFLRAGFEAAGCRAHAYTSPHLVRFHERIRIAGRLISERALAAVLRECEDANRGQPITYFEITTAAALLAFSRAPAEVALLEVGLGGRLDATNVIARPRVSVITPVALDHQHFLGDRLGAIAAEKAGIIRRGVPVVMGPQHAIAAKVIAARARALGAPLIRWGRDFTARLEPEALRFRDGRGATLFPPPALAGPHQAANAATAIVAARAFGEGAPDDDAIGRGLARAEWPARLQRLPEGPLTRELIARGFEVRLDGGHNPSAGRALARALEHGLDEGPQGRDGPLYVVAGMLSTKDPRGFLAPLASRITALWAVPVPGSEAGLAPARVAAIARRLGVSARVADGVGAAFAAIARRRPGRVLVTGSLYLAGAVLGDNGRAGWPR